MTERNPTVVVTSDETLSDIVARLREAANGGHTVDLVIPIDSALLLTAREFRTLKDAIDEDRVAVQMRTADPLRLQLAGRLGIPARALPRPRVVAAPAAISYGTASGRCGTAGCKRRGLARRDGCRGTSHSSGSRIALAEPERPER